MSEERDEGQFKRTLYQVYRSAAGLGDLPLPHATARGERELQERIGYVPPGGPPGSEAQVADLARGEGISDYVESRPVSKRPPGLLYQVQSTYDSRPVQGTDFQATACDSLVFAGAPPTFPAVSATYTVPENKIAVLRAFQYQVTPQPINVVSEGSCWLQSDLFDNDVIVPDYNGMVHPVYMRERFPVFAIFDERRIIKLRLSLVAGTVLAGLAGETLGVHFALYGNLILKTGIPKEFEIANKIAGL